MKWSLVWCDNPNQGISYATLWSNYFDELHSFHFKHHKRSRTIVTHRYQKTKMVIYLREYIHIERCCLRNIILKELCYESDPNLLPCRQLSTQPYSLQTLLFMAITVSDWRPLRWKEELRTINPPLRQKHGGGTGAISSPPHLLYLLHFCQLHIFTSIFSIPTLINFAYQIN